MATRSAVDIMNGEYQASLYRHWDGYPGVAIPPLLQAAEVARPAMTGGLQHRSVIDAADHLLGLLIPGSDHSPPRPRYHLTTGSEAHSDLDYRYVLNLNGEEPTIEARKCSTVDYARSIVASGRIFMGSLSESAKFCNADRQHDHERTGAWILADGSQSAAEATPHEVIPSRFTDRDEYRIPLDREAVITMLMGFTSEELGARPGVVAAVLQQVQDAGYDIRVHSMFGERHYLAIEPQTRTIEAFISKADAPNDWHGVLDLASRCGVIIA